MQNNHVVCFDGHVGTKVTGSISYTFTQEERKTTGKVGVKTEYCRSKTSTKIPTKMSAKSSTKKGRGSVYYLLFNVSVNHRWCTYSHPLHWYIILTGELGGVPPTHAPDVLDNQGLHHVYPSHLRVASLILAQNRNVGLEKSHIALKNKTPFFPSEHLLLTSFHECDFVTHLVTFCRYPLRHLVKRTCSSHFWLADEHVRIHGTA